MDGFDTEAAAGLDKGKSVGKEESVKPPFLSAAYRLPNNVTQIFDFPRIVRSIPNTFARRSLSSTVDPNTKTPMGDASGMSIR
jgi:hypothetical protein